jgi:hypothetical protein
MNKNNYAYIILAVVILLVIIVMAPKYFTGNITASETKISGDIEKIEVIHFHGTNQCYSCVTMGDLAEETINTYFQDELKSGKITFQHINAELPENYEIANKYGVTGSSLWIGTYYSDGSFKKEQNINVWYKINDKQDFMNYLKGVIKTKLSGE